MFDREFIYSILQNTDLKEIEDEEFNNKNFLYDYNEVQELYFDNVRNHFVYLTGITGLNKTKLLCRIIHDLIKSGVVKQEIIYADFELPFIRELPISTIVDLFPQKTDKPLYLIINEIGLKEGFFKEVKQLRAKHPNIKLLASTSIPFLIYEYLQNNPDDYSKVVVLSPKNDSNTKSESDTFGVYNHLKYNIKNSICEIKGLTKEGKLLSEHVIPQFINGYPVKIISSGAFHHRSELTKIELPETIEYIGDYAFTQCINLEEIKLPKNLKFIGDCAFLGAKRLKIITGGDNITHIGCSALYATEWLNTQTDDFIILGKVVYKYRGKQKSIVLPENVSILGSYSFRNTGIKEIDLSRIENIEEGCFFGCKKLFVVKNYANSNINSFVFYDCSSLYNLDIKITKTGKYAFYNCFELKEVIVYNAEFGTGTFENCNSLTTVTGSITIAEKCAFYKTSLTQADLKNIKFVGEFAFYSTQFNEILLKKIQKIGRHAFANIRKLHEVYLQSQAILGEGIFYGSDNINNAEVFGKYPFTYYFDKKTNIEKILVYGDCCDNFCRDNGTLKEVIIFNGKIGNWAFYNNTNLTVVKLKKCNGIGAWAFAHCNNLKNILMPESIKHVGMNAFRYCRKLTKIELQSSECVTFDANAFYSTAETKEIFVRDKKSYLSNPNWQEYKDKLKVSNLSLRRKNAITIAQENIGKTFKVIINRPVGSEHPKYKNHFYPINYGCVDNFVENKEIEIYIIDSIEPLNEAIVKIIGIVFRKNDDEIKGIGIVGKDDYTINDIKNHILFQEQYYDIEIFLKETVFIRQED